MSIALIVIPIPKWRNRKMTGQFHINLSVKILNKRVACRIQQHRERTIYCDQVGFKKP